MQNKERRVTNIGCCNGHEQGIEGHGTCESLVYACRLHADCMADTSSNCIGSAPAMLLKMNVARVVLKEGLLAFFKIACPKFVCGAIDNGS